jgi:hypothetical protein
MAEVSPGELFADYRALLDTQMALHNALQSELPDMAAELRHEIAAVTYDLNQIEASPWLTQSALTYGAELAYEVAVLRASPARNLDYETRESYASRLRQVAAFVLDRGIGSPELAEDSRLRDVQAALGWLAALAAPTAPIAEGLSAAEPDQSESTLERVDHDLALKSLRAHLVDLPPGMEFTLTPAQLLTIAAPGMGFSRWQRYRFLRRARQELVAEGFVFRYNHGRGKNSAYTVGRPTPPAQPFLRMAG